MKEVLLVGTGGMAVDYAKVLLGLQVPTTVIGRGSESARAFESATGLKAITGGLEAYLGDKPTLPQWAIVAVGVEALLDVSSDLLHAGVKKLLVEKPGALRLRDLEELRRLADQHQADVWIAYNRRFYASVLAAQELIQADGGATSFHFEFTEWSHVIEPLQKAAGVKEHWFLTNSTHVIDMAFVLGGVPATFDARRAGTLAWHPAAAVFAGSGQTQAGALFSYHANWAGPGRWGVEVLTSKRRFIFRPLEKLDVIALGSVKVEPVALEDELDQKFKPGLFRQVEAFFAESPRLCRLSEQLQMTKEVYYPMAGYNDEF